VRDGWDAGRLRHLVQDRAQPLALRRLAVQLLGRPRDPDTMDFLCGLLLVEEDALLRHDVLRELVRLRLSRGTLSLPEAAFRRQVGREAAAFERVRRVSAVYRRHQPGASEAEDPLVAMLGVLTEESLEQVFRLLMLLYRPDDIHLVYEQLQAPDVHLRADAIELLDNLVDPSMRVMLFPVLDESRFVAPGAAEETALREPAAVYRALQEAIWDHNGWLSVTTLCAVGRLRLPTMRDELERASRHSEPVIATAARFALAITDPT
jgi:hypothetical protein